MTSAIVIVSLAGCGDSGSNGASDNAEDTSGSLVEEAAGEENNAEDAIENIDLEEKKFEG